jgi:hypothetical protein
MEPEPTSSASPSASESDAVVPPPPESTAAEKGLPPVVPPSSRHLVQMFVVPGVIVGVVVLLGLFCSGALSWMFGLGHSRSPEAYLQRLEHPSSDVRWRAANDLVQVLKRDDQLASNPALGLKLAELLSQELERHGEDEKALLARLPRLSPQEALKERNQLKAQRDYIRFLSAALASMTVPVGVDPLRQMATIQTADSRSTAQLRRHAVWMLANLGENLKRYQANQAKGYPGLSAERRSQILAELQEIAGAAVGLRRQLAESTVDYLEGRRDLGIIAVLASLVDSDDPDLRKLVAYALTFWDGSADENELADRTLRRLAFDDGRGTRIILEDDD